MLGHCACLAGIKTLMLKQAALTLTQIEQQLLAGKCANPNCTLASSSTDTQHDHGGLDLSSASVARTKYAGCSVPASNIRTSIKQR